MVEAVEQERIYEVNGIIIQTVQICSESAGHMVVMVDMDLYDGLRVLCILRFVMNYLRRMESIHLLGQMCIMLVAFFLEEKVLVGL